MATAFWRASLLCFFVACWLLRDEIAYYIVFFAPTVFYGVWSFFSINNKAIDVHIKQLQYYYE